MQSTRQEILEILREAKQSTVEDLAKRLGLTPMTIRHHLNVLQAQNMVMVAEIKRSPTVGRPRLLYSLTETVEELFPQGYGRLASYLVRELKERMGAKEVESLFRRVAERMAQEAPPWIEGQTFEERLGQIAEFLKEQGFVIRWEKTDEGYLFTNVNCPYRRIARDHGELCGMDAALIHQLLGVEPRRLSRPKRGEAPCSYLLIPPSS